MLHARNEDNIDRFKARQVSVDGEVARIIEPEDESEPVLESRMMAIEEDTGKDSGNESIDTDSDSEDKKESIKAIQNAMVGMNVSQTLFLRISRPCDWKISRSLSSAIDLSMIESELDPIATTV